MICVNAFAQKTYTFDYYAIYDLGSYHKRYVLGNSQDASYFLHLYINDNILNQMSLYDIKNDSQYQFNVKMINIDSVKSFSDLAESYTIYNFGFSEREKLLKDTFEIEYDSLNSDETIITIKGYKNKRKKKLVYTTVCRLKDYPYAKNQFYVTDIVFAFKLDLNKIKASGVLTEQYTVYEKTPNEIHNTKTLLDIGQLDFSMELETEPVITRTKTIIQFR